MKLLTEIKVKLGYKDNDIFDAILKKYHVSKSEITKLKIVKESIDARKKPNVIVSLNVAVEVTKSAYGKIKNEKDFQMQTGLEYKNLNIKAKSPVIVGFGPAGMFAGLALAQMGLKPIILEQGKDVDNRQKDVDNFWNNRILNKFSNVQFGEGGAGTFSDGKLASNVSNEYTKKCIYELFLNGAPEEITYSFTPHIGSDKLKEVVKNIREKIKSLGGKVIFNAHFDNFEIANGKVAKVFYFNIETNKQIGIETSSLILAVGHSAVDVYKLLKEKGITQKQKPFAMGVRIEGLQSEINNAQYGFNENGLPPASYKLVEHLENGRSVFSFCMCPGGAVVASSSEEETIVSNGMSNSARDGKNANSALLVNVVPEDFESSDELAGLDFQRKYEKLAFALGGSNYDAPAEKVKDFLTKKTKDFDESIKKVYPTYKPRIKFANLKECLPNFVYESLLIALPKFNKKINGIADGENLLIGIESRSSSPVQIVRNENFESVSISGLFVCGEGAGYAGGITSSAQDGMKCAEKVAEFLTK